MGVSRLVTCNSLNRLTTATTPSESFSYDSVGNRNPLTQVYNTANRLLDDGTFTYTYDANGNMISKTNKITLQTTTFTYDPENQLTRIDLPGGTFAEYTYDALGRRIQKNVNGTITRYVYDNEDILEEYDSTNTLRARWTHGPGIDEPFTMERDMNGDGLFGSNETFHYLADGLGSIAAITDTLGNVVEQMDYKVFGKATIKDSLGNTLPQSQIGNFYTFTARELDPESGLLFYRARTLDPDTGTFLQEDPLGPAHLFDPQLGNKYPYAINNPQLFDDPFGQQRKMNTGDALGSSLEAGRQFIETLTDIRLIKEVIDAVEQYKSMIPKGQERDILVLVDPITKRVIGVVDSKVGAITRQGVEIIPVRVQGTGPAKTSPPVTKAVCPAPGR